MLWVVYLLKIERLCKRIGLSRGLDEWDLPSSMEPLIPWRQRPGWCRLRRSSRSWISMRTTGESGYFHLGRWGRTLMACYWAYSSLWWRSLVLGHVPWCLPLLLLPRERQRLERCRVYGSCTRKHVCRVVTNHMHLHDTPATQIFRWCCWDGGAIVRWAVETLGSRQEATSYGFRKREATNCDGFWQTPTELEIESGLVIFPRCQKPH